MSWGLQHEEERQGLVTCGGDVCFDARDEAPRLVAAPGHQASGDEGLGGSLVKGGELAVQQLSVLAGHVGAEERLRDLGLTKELLPGTVARLYYSKLTVTLYLVTFVVSSLLLCINLGVRMPLRTTPGIILLLEVAVNVSLFVEVGLRAAVLGADYLRSWPNVLDSFVASASAILFFVAAPGAGDKAGQGDVELSQGLVMLRTGVQFGRLILIAQHARRSQKAQASTDISFSTLAESMAGVELDFSMLHERQLILQAHNEEDGL